VSSQAEPRLGTVTAKLGDTEFDNFECGMARKISRAERRGGPTSRGGPSVDPKRLSHRPPGASAATTRAEKRVRSSGSSKT